jgi:Pseudouridylate synthase
MTGHKPCAPQGLKLDGKVYFRLFYDGAHYAGWSKQKDKPTVQCVLENALLKTGCVVKRIKAFSRTDGGVSSLSQIIALEGLSVRPLAANRVLPKDVAITHYATHLGKVSSKTYVYVKKGRWLHPEVVNEAYSKLNREGGLNKLYKKGGATPSESCQIEFLSTATNEFIFFRARGFGYQQVRRIVGYLTLADSTGTPPTQFSSVHSANPRGLILVKISDDGANWVMLEEGLIKVRRYLSSKISDLEWSLSV